MCMDTFLIVMCRRAHIPVAGVSTLVVVVVLHFSFYVYGGVRVAPFHFGSVLLTSCA